MTNENPNTNSLKTPEPFDPELEMTELQPRVLKRLLLRWVIRTVIGAIVFLPLARNFEWGKWLLWIWIPLAGLSLLVILIGGYVIEKKFAEVQTRLHEITEEDEP